MPRGDSQESQRRSFRAATVLFPIAQGVNADTDRSRKLDLCESDKPAQRHHVGTRLESPRMKRLRTLAGIAVLNWLSVSSTASSTCMSIV